MNEQEIRRAVEFHKGTFNPAIVPLVELAEAWLARKMPEKCNVDDCKFVTHTTAMCCLKNETIDACRLASVVSEDEDDTIEFDADGNRYINH